MNYREFREFKKKLEVYDDLDSSDARDSIIATLHNELQSQVNCNDCKFVDTNKCWRLRVYQSGRLNFTKDKEELCIYCDFDKHSLEGDGRFSLFSRSRPIVSKGDSK